MDGSIATIFAVCAILLTISFVAGTVVVIRTLIQVRETARRAEDLARRLEPTVGEVELAVREWRQVGEHVSHTAESAQRLSERFEGMGSKAADAGKVVLSGIGGPVGRTMAIMNAFRIGADVFFRLTGRNQKADGKKDGARTKRKTETASSETDSSKEVGGEQ
jgi:hypothetical protein